MAVAVAGSRSGRGHQCQADLLGLALREGKQMVVSDPRGDEPHPDVSQPGGSMGLTTHWLDLSEVRAGEPHGRRYGCWGLLARRYKFPKRMEGTGGPWGLNRPVLTQGAEKAPTLCLLLEGPVHQRSQQRKGT